MDCELENKMVHIAIFKQTLIQTKCDVNIENSRQKIAKSL